MGWQTVGHPQLMLSVVLDQALYLWQHLVQSFTHQVCRFLKKPWRYYLYWQWVKWLCIVKESHKCSTTLRFPSTKGFNIFRLIILVDLEHLSQGKRGPTAPSCQSGCQCLQLGDESLRSHYPSGHESWGKKSNVRMNCRNRSQVNLGISLLLVRYQQLNAI